MIIYRQIHRIGFFKNEKAVKLMKYICSICGYVYDETEQGPWAALPDSWTCPLCHAPKSAFRAQESAPAPTPAAKPAPALQQADALRPMTAMELHALCSYLAKGCEKQYKAKEAALFGQLADWYAAQAQPAREGSFGELLELVQSDLENSYPAAHATADAAPDRGAKRALVWSEKVTRMLDSLLRQYEAQGDGLLENTNVYVCEICGFVYVGDVPPAVCPVCKVPSFKLAKLERS